MQPHTPMQTPIGQVHNLRARCPHSPETPPLRCAKSQTGRPHIGRRGSHLADVELAALLAVEGLAQFPPPVEHEQQPLAAARLPRLHSKDKRCLRSSSHRRSSSKPSHMAAVPPAATTKPHCVHGCCTALCWLSLPIGREAKCQSQSPDRYAKAHHFLPLGGGLSEGGVGAVLPRAGRLPLLQALLPQPLHQHLGARAQGFQALGFLF